MIAQNQLKKPSNWQDFEKLCKLLWGEIWTCEDTINDMVAKGEISMVLVYFHMLKNMADIVIFNAKVRMTMRMLS